MNCLPPLAETCREIETQPSVEDLHEELKMKRSGRRTFLPRELKQINELFKTFIEDNKPLKSKEIDAVMKKYLPKMMEKHGEVKLRAKFRDLKKKFLDKKNMI